MNLKRLSLIMICSVAMGKIVTVAVVRLAENSNITSHALGRSFLESATDDQMKMAPAPNNLNITRVPPRFRTNRFNSRPLILAQNPVATVAAKTKESKAVEDAKKERERRKNRKKKLEETKETPAVAAVAPAPFVPYQTPQNVNSTPVVSAGGFAKPQPTSTPGTDVTTPISTTPTVGSSGGGTTNSAALARWQNLLITSPSAALMTSFEDLYKSREITESQFYQVINAMQTSTNSEARNYAVQAADLSQNIYSFKILADESQNETVAAVKTLATTDVNAYASQTDLPILDQALKSSDTSEEIVASRLISSLSHTTVASARSVLGAFVASLAPLTNDSNTEVQMSAAQALNDIMGPYRAHSKAD